MDHVGTHFFDDTYRMASVDIGQSADVQTRSNDAYFNTEVIALTSFCIALVVFFAVITRRSRSWR